jgi:PAP2 superfamily
MIYNLPGSQVEPHSSYWTEANAPLLSAIRMEDLIKETDDENNPRYYPAPPIQNSKEQIREIEELFLLAGQRNDPAGLTGGREGEKRLPISFFLQHIAQPIGAVYNKANQNNGQPIIQTGHELARWFEDETPGLAHRNALNWLFTQPKPELFKREFSPVRQALIWASLDVTIYSAISAAWHYKWYTKREDVRFRPRPYEAAPLLPVLFDYKWNAENGQLTTELKNDLNPSPGTPRHPAYPSGHSTVAGAASEILSFWFPEFKSEFDNLADNAGMARLWAGIHYRSDHENGINLGKTIARKVIEQIEQACIPFVSPVMRNAPKKAFFNTATEKLKNCVDKNQQYSIQQLHNKLQFSSWENPAKPLPNTDQKEEINVKVSGSNLYVSDASNTIGAEYLFSAGETDFYAILKKYPRNFVLDTGKSIFPAEGIIAFNNQSKVTTLKAVGRDRITGGGWIFNAAETTDNKPSPNEPKVINDINSDVRFKNKLSFYSCPHPGLIMNDVHNPFEETLTVSTKGNILTVSAEQSIVALYAFSIDKADYYFTLDELPQSMLLPYVSDMPTTSDNYERKNFFPSQGMVKISKINGKLKLDTYGWDENGKNCRGWIFDAEEL